ncbi:nuclear transport factor 2 family protein [Halomonas sediminis]
MSHAALEAFCAFFKKLDKTCTDDIYKVYTEDVIFVDPLHHIEGREALKSYFATLYDNVQECGFTFHQQLCQGDSAFVTWTMHFSHPRLGGGKRIDVEGCSRLQFADDGSGRVTRHRDYFDAGAMLYEHLPLMGGTIRWLKRRLN